MQYLPFDICMEVCLNISLLEDLISMSRTSKIYHRVYDSDIFWEKYYHRYVNPIYAPKLTDKKKEKGKETDSWKKRFFQGYTQIKVLDCTQITPDIIWYIYDCNQYNNYMTINKTENGSLVGIPVIPLLFFSEGEEYKHTVYRNIYLHRILSEPEDTEYVTVVMAHESFMEYEGTFKTLKLVTYPFHHRTIINTASWEFEIDPDDRFNDDSLDEESENFELSKRGKSIKLLKTIIYCFTGALSCEYPVKDILIPKKEKIGFIDGYIQVIS